ncbi:MAG: hypothetical protein HY515_01765 [Candidatus Aenigmarchaeota archaeon]|nr:hypothetical protein [Candidatus Aenigmarchaeota archaeon]
MAENTKYVVQIKKNRNGWNILLNHVENGGAKKSETGPHDLGEAIAQGINKLNEWKNVEEKKVASSQKQTPTTVRS